MQRQHVRSFTLCLCSSAAVCVVVRHPSYFAVLTRNAIILCNRSSIVCSSFQCGLLLFHFGEYRLGWQLPASRPIQPQDIMPYPVPYLSKYLTAARLRVDRLVALGVLVCSAKCQ